MTTDTQLAPTDAELLGLNVGEVYFSESPSKYPEVHGTQYHAGAPGVLAFARAVLARWGQPARSGEPVATVIKRGASRDWMSERLGGLPDGVYSLYLAPQPMEREPLSDEWIRSRCKDSWIFDTAKQWVRMTEAAHGIKGGQHGTE